MSAVEIEVIWSDKDEHRRRVETRETDVQGLRKPSWQEVMDRHYENWGQNPYIVDTAKQDVAQSVDELISQLGIGREQTMP